MLDIMTIDPAMLEEAALFLIVGVFLIGFTAWMFLGKQFLNLYVSYVRLSKEVEEIMQTSNATQESAEAARKSSEDNKVCLGSLKTSMDHVLDSINRLDNRHNPTSG